MAKMISAYPGKLVLPDGTEIVHGAEVEIGKDLAANAGVAEWVKAGFLIEPAKK